MQSLGCQLLPIPKQHEEPRFKTSSYTLLVKEQGIAMLSKLGMHLHRISLEAPY